MKTMQDLQKMYKEAVFNEVAERALQHPKQVAMWRKRKLELAQKIKEKKCSRTHG